jgi:hypothetical protein
MRRAVLLSAIVLVAIFALAPAGQTQKATQTPTDDVKISAKAATAPEPPEPPIPIRRLWAFGRQSARLRRQWCRRRVHVDLRCAEPKADLHGWLLYQNNSGTFRLVPKPGRYVVHGPGGVKPIGQGRRVGQDSSIADLPVAPWHAPRAVALARAEPLVVAENRHLKAS